MHLLAHRASQQLAGAGGPRRPSFRENWDQFLWPLVIVSREALKTFPLGLALFEGSFNASYHEMMAAAVVGMVPMMVLFLVFQRAFVRGLTLTGLKE